MGRRKTGEMVKVGNGEMVKGAVQGGEPVPVKAGVGVGVVLFPCPYCRKECPANQMRGTQYVGGNPSIAGEYRYRKCKGCAATFRTVKLYAELEKGEQVRI